MIQEFFTSFKENVNQKIRNPFLGTFAIVWIVRNWKFVFTFFNFDKNLTLDQRIAIIENHFKNYSIFWSILNCTLITIGLLVLTYSLLALSRLIINFYEKVVNPYVYKITDKSSIVLKSDYITLRESLQRLETKLEDERSNRLRIQNDYELLEKRMADLLNKNNKVASDLNINETNNGPLVYSGDHKIDLFVEKIINDKLFEKFDEVTARILDKSPIQRSDPILNEFIKMGLITRGDNHDNISWYYDFTETGRKVFDAILFEKLNRRIN